MKFVINSSGNNIFDRDVCTRLYTLFIYHRAVEVEKKHIKTGQVAFGGKFFHGVQ
jgi:hypothetical protein